MLCYKIFLVQAEPVYWKTHHLFGQKRINIQSAFIIFKMFSLRLKLNLRKPDVFKFTRFEAGICDECLPEVPTSYDFRARACFMLTRSQGVANLLYALCAPDVSFQRGFFTYVKLRADLQSKKFHFSGLQFIQLTLVKKKKTDT